MKRQDSLLSQADQKERIELFVSCRNLDDLKFFSVTDSFLIVKLIEANHPDSIILKTKVYPNDLNPNYSETVLIDFYFEVKQKLIFEVYHQDSPPKLVGRMESSVGQIFGSQQHGLVRDLKNKDKKAGKIVVRCQKQDKDKKKMITFRLSARNLPDYKWWFFFGGTVAFYRIFRKRLNDELMIYESQTINSRNPTWRQVCLSERRLVGSDRSKQIQIRFYNLSNSGQHDVIGSVRVSPADLMLGLSVDILNNRHQSKGTLIFDNYLVRVQYQFGDFIQKGLQLALVTCIDFTASNKPAQNPLSLHYGYNGPSHYQRALTDVTHILLDYDYDKLVPLYGFGAMVQHPLLNTQKKVHHCFPLNGNLQNPNCYLLQETIKTYRNMIPYLQFAGPTYFSGLLRQAMAQCQQFKKLGTHYMILFILTDGDIHDKQEVFDLLIKCNFLPMSVIIVGLGNGTFEIMNELDDDNCEMVDSKGNKTQRDLVQFVQFAKFANNGEALAKQVLYELPRQVSQYFQLMNKSPEDVANSYQVDDIQRVRRLQQAENPYLI